ncbi:UNVERIFIED_CONTAM: hypothetical protein RMT77_019035 [Armadillidium vulgare]
MNKQIESKFRRKKCKKRLNQLFSINNKNDIITTIFKASLSGPAANIGDKTINGKIKNIFYNLSLKKTKQNVKLIKYYINKFSDVFNSIGDNERQNNNPEEKLSAADDILVNEDTLFDDEGKIFIFLNIDI